MHVNKIHQEELIIPGSLAALEQVHAWVVEKISVVEIRDEDRHNILLAVSEAVTNAIRHGSKEKVQNAVEIHFRLDGNAITFAVHDSGEGFSPDALPDPTSEEHLFQTGGRGVFLLKALASNVEFLSTDTGTTVSFSFTWD